MSEKKVPAPSYPTAAIGGFFLGVLGMTAILFHFGFHWLFLLVPAVGLVAGILGAYVAAEPYDELRRKYDELARSAKPGTDKELAEVSVKLAALEKRVKVLRDRLGKEATRLVADAASLGADGVKIAEAAEILRKEAASLYEESN